MNIAIIGYGKMGKEIEKIALERNHTVITIIDSEADWKKEEALIKQADAAIEFSTPDTAVENTLRCFEYDIPVVVGSTGWYDKLPELEKYCISNQKSMLYAANFSIGVNIFFKLNQELAKMMNNFDDYDVSLEETHHIYKQDSPSATALRLVNDLISNLNRKEKWLKSTITHPDEIEVKSFREGNVPGIHLVTYESDCDIVEIKHSATNRKGFALGAVKAAEWLIGKKGVYQMKDVLQF